MRNHDPVRRAALALLGSLVAALTAATSAPAAVDGGTIWVNRGSAGVRLEMRRAVVVDKLGPPIEKNRNGWMAFAEEPDLFDVYLNRRNRVRLLGISGNDFCLSDGPCMFERNGVRKLRQRFGDRLKEVEDETGETVLVVRGRYHHRRVFTAFTPTTLRGRGRIIMVFIGRCPPRPIVCGA
jgi:hypothetical protein